MLLLCRVSPCGAADSGLWVYLSFKLDLICLHLEVCSVFMLLQTFFVLLSRHVFASKIHHIQRFTAVQQFWICPLHLYFLQLHSPISLFSVVMSADEKTRGLVWFGLVNLPTSVLEVSARRTAAFPRENECGDSEFCLFGF